MDCFRAEKQQKVTFAKWQRENYSLYNTLKKVVKINKDDDSSWTEPSYPAEGDVFNSVMTEFLNEANGEVDKLMFNFNDTVKKCKNLADALGEKLTNDYPLHEFWKTLSQIKVR